MYELAAVSTKAGATVPRHAPADGRVPIRPAASDQGPRMFNLAPGASTGIMKDKAEHWLYVVAGRGVVKRNGAPIALKRGTLVVIRRNERHEIVSDGGEPLRAVSMNSAFAMGSPARRWFEGSGATIAAVAGLASIVISVFYRLVG